MGWSGSLFPIPSIWDPHAAAKNSWVAAGFGPTTDPSIVLNIATATDTTTTTETVIKKQRRKKK